MHLPGRQNAHSRPVGMAGERRSIADNPADAQACMEESLANGEVIFVPHRYDPRTSSSVSTDVSDFNMIDWGVLSRVHVYDPLGEAHEFQKLYSPRLRFNKGPCIIHFLSNFACYAMVARLTQWIHAKEALDACNARLIFLATGTPEQSMEFMQLFEKAGEDFPGELYCDPSLQIYRAFDLKRGFLRTVVPPLTTGLAKFGVRNVKEGIKRRIVDRHLIGDLWQMGGVVVVQGNHDDPHFRPQLLFRHADSTTVQTPSVFEVLRAVGFDGNLDIRPDACLTEFNEKVKMIETPSKNYSTPSYSSLFGSATRRISNRFRSQSLPRDCDDIKSRRTISSRTVSTRTTSEYASEPTTYKSFVFD